MIIFITQAGAETVGCQSRRLCDQPRRHDIDNGYAKYVSAIELTEERQGLWLAIRPKPVRIHDGRHFLTTRPMVWHPIMGHDNASLTKCGERLPSVVLAHQSADNYQSALGQKRFTSNEYVL